MIETLGLFVAVRLSSLSFERYHSKLNLNQRLQCSFRYALLTIESKVKGFLLWKYTVCFVEHALLVLKRQTARIVLPTVRTILGFWKNYRNEENDAESFYNEEHILRASHCNLYVTTGKGWYKLKTQILKLGSKFVFVISLGLRAMRTLNIGKSTWWLGC